MKIRRFSFGYVNGIQIRNRSFTRD